MSRLAAPEDEDESGVSVMGETASTSTVPAAALARAPTTDDPSGICPENSEMGIFDRSISSKISLLGKASWNGDMRMLSLSSPPPYSEASQLMLLLKGAGLLRRVPCDMSSWRSLLWRGGCSRVE